MLAFLSIISLFAATVLAAILPENGAQAIQKRANCPANITNTQFEFPHLIIPTSSEQRSQAFGTSLRAYISPINTTLFRFDVAPTYAGTCALIFLFPYGSDLDPTAGKYYFSGTEAEVGMDGGLNVSLLSGNAEEDTTFDSTPSVSVDYGKTQIIPGSQYTIATFPCPSGQRVTYAVASRGKVHLDYFQSSGNQAIGLYVVPCV